MTPFSGLQKAGFNRRWSRSLIIKYALCIGEPLAGRYAYDLRIPSGVDPAPFQPEPLDGEVESFEARRRLS